MNVDWFNSFIRTQHSEGAIYLSILNLPRHERFLQENVLLVGIVPGPKEPLLHINSYLRPLVDEVKLLWKGVCLKNSRSVTILVRGALLCVGCDIPAARKVGGFVNHRATKGSKYHTSFPTSAFGEKANYSNFDRNSWIPRTNENDRANALKHFHSATFTYRKKVETDTGVRYSVLLERPYFNAPRMCVIDLMHNLLLGTAKRKTEVWKNVSILDSKCFSTIQNKVDSFISPPDTGCILSKVMSRFSGFTANRWKNRTIFSLLASKNVLGRSHYNCLPY